MQFSSRNTTNVTCLITRNIWRVSFACAYLRHFSICKSQHSIDLGGRKIEKNQGEITKLEFEIIIVHACACLMLSS